MVSRDELKNAAYAELTGQGYLPTSKTDRIAVVDVVVAAVEPLILDDLYSQILAMPTDQPVWVGDRVDYLLYRSEVLALLDGDDE